MIDRPRKPVHGYGLHRCAALARHPQQHGSQVCCRDNVFVERPWKAIKYEHVYRLACERVFQTRTKIAIYLEFCNGRQPHNRVDRRAPGDACFDLSSFTPAT